MLRYNTRYMLRYIMRYEPRYIWRYTCCYIMHYNTRCLQHFVFFHIPGSVFRRRVFHNCFVRAFRLFLFQFPALRHTEAGLFPDPLLPGFVFRRRSQATAFSTSVTGKWKQEAISGTDMGTPGTRQTALSGLAAAMVSMQCHTPSTEAPSGSFIIIAVMFSRSFVTCAFWFSIKWYELLSGDADSTPQKALPLSV